MKTILCYGDSNTWGCIPIKPNSMNLPLERYSRSERWTGILQKVLKNDYVIEEGLNSRTTNIDYKSKPNRNGKPYLLPCLYSHAPIDLVVISLGSNDLSPEFNRSAKDICAGLSELIDIIQSSNCGPELKQSPQILILSQPIPLPVCKKYIGVDFDYEEVKGKAEALIPLYANLAKEKNCQFLDVSKSIKFSEIDGMHLDKEEHSKLAQIVIKAVKNCFPENSKEEEHEGRYKIWSKL